MTSNKILSTVSKRTGYTKDACSYVLDVFFDEVKRYLSSGESVNIKGFAVFNIVEKGEHRGFNINDKTFRVFPPHKTLRCEISKSFKDAINDRGSV